MESDRKAWISPRPEIPGTTKRPQWRPGRGRVRWMQTGKLGFPGAGNSREHKGAPIAHGAGGMHQAAARWNRQDRVQYAQNGVDGRDLRSSQADASAVCP